MIKKMNLGKGKDGTVYKLTINLCDKEGPSPRLDIDLNSCHQYTELSICGDMYENGKDIGGGQCLFDVMSAFPNDVDIQRLCLFWGLWHLNGLKAGTRKQTEAILEYQQEHPEWQYEYSNACDILKEAELLEDRGYKYGECWLVEVIPDEVITEIKELVNKLQSRE